MPLTGLATAVSSDRDFRTMAATPPSFADRPPGTDVLADMLRAVRLTGAVFLKASFTEPFGVLSPQAYDPSIPMAHLRHVSVFHYVATGGCNIETAGGQRRELVAGDLLRLPFAADDQLGRGNARIARPAARAGGRRSGAAALRGRAQAVARQCRVHAGLEHRPSGCQGGRLVVHAWRRRHRDALRLRLHRIGGDDVRADVPLAAGDAGRPR